MLVPNTGEIFVKLNVINIMQSLNFAKKGKI